MKVYLRDIVAVLALAVGIGFLLLFVYWLIFPINILEVDQPYKVLNPNKRVESGGLLQYEANSCKYVSSPAHITTSFVNDIIYTTGSITTNVQKGCTVRVQYAEVPKYLPPGTYQYKILLIYDINPIRSVTYNIYTEEFQVTDGMYKEDNTK